MPFSAEPREKVLRREQLTRPDPLTLTRPTQLNTKHDLCGPTRNKTARGRVTHIDVATCVRISFVAIGRWTPFDDQTNAKPLFSLIGLRGINMLPSEINDNTYENTQ